MTVHIDIGEIVLHGVAVDDVAEFRTALTEALTGLAATAGGRLTGRQAGTLRAPGVRADRRALAADIAGSVWHAVSAAAAIGPASGAGTAPPARYGGGVGA